MFDFFCKDKNFGKILKNNIKKLFLIFFVFMFMFVGLAVILPPRYTSSTLLLPITSSPSLGELASLAAIAGLNIGQSGDINKIMAVLESRTIRKRIIEKLDLIPVLFPEEEKVSINKAIKVLGKKVKIKQDKNLNTIEIEVHTKDPVLSQKIANQYIIELRQLLNEKNLSVAKFDRVFLEKKLKEEEEKLIKLQKTLADFQKKTKLLNPDSELKNIFDTYLSLLNKRTELLMELSTLETTLSPNHPKVKAIKMQISFIDNTLKKFEEDNKFFPALKKLPDILADYMDIVRQLKTEQEIYEVLLKMYQQAKFNESKEQLFVEVIDPPLLPDTQDLKPRILVIVIGLFVSAILSLSIVVFTSCRKRET